jgi:hypothetical protein
MSLIVLFFSFPSVNSVTFFVRIFDKNNLISLLFHVCVYFVCSKHEIKKILNYFYITFLRKR